MQTRPNLDRILRNTEQKISSFLLAKLTALRKSVREITLDEIGDVSEDHRLADAVVGSFFAPQLEAIRSTLLRDATALGKDRSALTSQTIDILGQLSAETASDEIVLRGHQDVTSLRRAAGTLAVNSRLLIDRTQRLFAARRVLAGAVEFRNQLDHEMASAADPDLSASFDVLMEQVRAELSSRKEAALDQTDVWDSRLTELRNRRDTTLKAARDAFETRRDHYQDLLRRYAGAPADRNLFATNFNPADPLGSEKALVADVSRTVQGAFGHIEEILATLQTDIRQVLASGDLVYMDDADRLEKESRDLLIELDDQTARATQTKLGALDHDSVLDLNDGGRFTGMLVDLATRARTTAELGRRCRGIQATVAPRKLGPAERSLLKSIERLSAGSAEPIDIAALLDQPESTSTLLADLWPLIDGLYRKRRLRVRIDLVRTDG